MTQKLDMAEDDKLERIYSSPVTAGPGPVSGLFSARVRVTWDVIFHIFPSKTGSFNTSFSCNVTFLSHSALCRYIYSSLVLFSSVLHLFPRLAVDQDGRSDELNCPLFHSIIISRPV